MGKTIKISIKCFGMFRQFGNVIDIEIPAGSFADEIKSALIINIGDKHRNLVESSVLANDVGILPKECVIQDSMNLSILPPVCGG
ncbi:MAG: MoaD/ThiS family protein [Alphaproteobacteria bacterium]|nr:MoaD/ThiS family protein [Alphaproteobacteria bacterium]MCB9984713.1 MoaD/ThiS family protein [Micavibrio sp.]